MSMPSKPTDLSAASADPCSQSGGSAGVLRAAPESWPIPREVAGVRLPDSRLAQEATEFTREASSPVVFNHAMRTYLFGELLGRRQGLHFDPELFYLGAVFHDLGQTERFMGEQRFEVDGADAAAAFLVERGIPVETVEVVWDAVALHTSLGIVHRKRPEIALVSAGAGLDVAGRGFDLLDRSAIEAVVAAFPRPTFKATYQQVLAEIVTRKPETACWNFLAGIGRRHVPGFEEPNICDWIEDAPFAE